MLSESTDVTSGALISDMAMTIHPTATGTTETTMVITAMTTIEDSMDNKVD